MARKENSKKIPADISPDVEERVVQVSLENPDYGPQRLVSLLEQEGIFLATSAVYTILKRNNLQNRSLRISRLEEQQAAEIIPEPPTTAEPPLEEPTTIPAHTIEIEPEPPKPPATKFLSKFTGRRLWSFTVPSLLVIGLVAYFLISAAVNLLRAEREPVRAPEPAPAEATTKGETTVRPLEDYDIISERNLFGAVKGRASSPQEKIPVENFPTADASLGLKLVGTVAGDDPETSFAIIDNKNTRKQELYQEGDKAGDVLIKKILRNQVIVDAGRGDQVLTLELEESGKKIDLALASRPPVDFEPGSTRRIHQNFLLSRQEVQSSLGNIVQLFQQSGISPYFEGDQSAGFTISNVSSESVFAKIGLRSGDAILAVNGEAITGPQQAGQFFQRLKDGGDVIIKVKKGRGVRSRTRVIRTHIE